MSGSTKRVEGGIYRHYKGKMYRYLRVVRHSETLEELALYETLYENDLGSVWVRPLNMFFEDVEVDGKLVPRFAYIGNESGSRRV
jgi:hypothetical protein